MYDKQKIDVMIDGSYKKLKSYYYYDKTVLFIKEEIAKFETASNFEERLDILKKNLIEENDAYFDNLIERMDSAILPKKMKGQNVATSVIRSDIDDEKEINRINFFIQLPIELYIIDTLWMLIIGKIANDIYGYTMHSYAGKFKKNIFYNGIEDIYLGVDFKSNRCFKPYFNLYSRWRDDALECVKRNNDKSTLIMGMDLKNFYYSVQFKFQDLNEFLGFDKRLCEIEFLSRKIEQIYLKYTDYIKKYKMGICEEKDTSILPIGLLSSIVLRELYLRKFDMQFFDKLHPLHYGRYVDDILLVIEDTEENVNENNEYYIEKFLVQNDLFFKSEMEMRSVSNPEIVIQTEKMTCFYFEKNKKDILIEAYYEQLDKNSSEANLMPDMDLLESSFYSKAYQVNLEGGSKKIRDIKILESNNYNVTKYINDLKRTLKNTRGYNDKIKKYLEQILYFYKGSAAIEYMSSWKSLFELLVLCSEKEKANEFYLNVKELVEKIDEKIVDIEDIFETRKEEVVQKVKKSLNEYLLIALSLAVGLDYSCVKSNKKDILELAKIFRKSNLINHQMVYFPLINYTDASILNAESLISNNKKENLMDDIKWKQEYALSDFKVRWSPRFIHLNEIYLWYFLCYFSDRNSEKIIYDEIRQQFIDDNSLSDYIKNPVYKSEIRKGNVSLVNYTEIANEVRNNVRIAVVNTRITEQDALNALDDVNVNLSFEKKRALYKILNIAVEEKVDYIVFPEFYLPYLWLDDLMKYAKQNNITIITGLQYLTYGQQAYNITVVAMGTKNGSGFRNSILIYREKNYYAPDEKVLLAQRRYRCIDTDFPFFFIVKNGKISFTIMLCYEFTDISSRADLKSHINFLFVPQMNPDTHYFSSIVESTARDLYTFVIQANTSKYGDSRITAPAKTNFREILQVKGGINDAVLVGEIDINEFEKCKSQYAKKLTDAILKCMNCSSRECDKCGSKPEYKHNSYKGLPARYEE